jgi:hypothetical protein
MSSYPMNIYNGLVEFSKFDIEVIDALRPVFITKHNIDIYDILFKDFIQTSYNSSNNVRSESPDFRPSSPDWIVDNVGEPNQSESLSDRDSYSSGDNSSVWSHNSFIDKDFEFVDPSERDVSYDGQNYVNDRVLHEGHHYCSYRSCQMYNFLCGNSFENQRGSIKKCGYQCNYFCELPHNCEGAGYSFSNRDSRSHNGPIVNSSRRFHQSSSRNSYNH